MHLNKMEDDVYLNNLLFWIAFAKDNDMDSLQETLETALVKECEPKVKLDERKTD